MSKIRVLLEVEFDLGDRDYYRELYGENVTVGQAVEDEIDQLYAAHVGGVDISWTVADITLRPTEWKEE